MGNSLNILNTCLPQQTQQNQNDNASDENVAPTPIESSKSRPGLQLGKKPLAKSASSTTPTSTNNSSSTTSPTVPNASTSTTATTWEDMDDNWNEEAKGEEVVESNPSVDSSLPATSNLNSTNSSSSTPATTQQSPPSTAKANNSSTSAPPLSKSNSASVQPNPEPDFFSDMQPVYKAPKKVSLEKKETEEKSDRLSRIAMDSSIVNDEKGGWENSEELLTESPNNSFISNSNGNENENGKGTESGSTAVENGNGDNNEKQDRKHKSATAKKEAKPKLQAVKVSGSKPNFDDSEEEQAVTQ